MANDLFSQDKVMLANPAELKALQDELTRLSEAVSTQGGLKADLNKALLQLQRYALGIVHVVTGRLKNSIFIDVKGSGNDLVGHLATNVAYAIDEEQRGGKHAFFGRTVKEEGPNVNDIFKQGVTRGRTR